MTNFVCCIHFIKSVYAFESVRALILLAVTASGGFVVGSVGAIGWNAASKPEPRIAPAIYTMKRIARAPSVRSTLMQSSGRTLRGRP
ncbi:MAG: hypothetical protein EXQ91_09215 [Alphaproteobacteria bacterium]|nr:hypothetical protein [Alphaproteobacteria bacterium]